MELNDDCLILIFSQLNIKDQIAVASVCRRFRAILTDLWRRAYVNFTDSGLRHIVCFEFSVLIKCICSTVKTMKLQDLTFERFQVLKMYTYPKLISFSFYHSYPYTLKDDSILDMTKMFPKLQYFAPYGAFSGMYMEKWRHLRHLDLSNCDKKKFNCLEKIFERSQLKSINLNVFRKFYKWTSRRAFKNFCALECITLNSYELKWLTDIMEFSNLKELIVKNRDREAPFRELLLNLHEFKHNDIIELETQIPFPFCIPPTDVFENLRKLVVRDRNISEYNDVHESAPNLREITFQKCEVWEANDITFWFKNSSSLNLISIEECHCGFREFTVNVMDIAQKRTNVLNFNFHDNTFFDVDSDYYSPYLSYTPIILNIIGSSSLFQRTSNSTPYKFMTLRIQFH